MTKRITVIALSLLAIALALLLQPAAQAMTDEMQRLYREINSPAGLQNTAPAKVKYNLVSIVTDDQALWSIGAYGARDAITPNMEGMLNLEALPGYRHHGQDFTPLLFGLFKPNSALETKLQGKLNGPCLQPCVNEVPLR